MNLTPAEHRALAYQYDPDTYSRFGRRQTETMQALDRKGLVRNMKGRYGSPEGPHFWDDWEITRKGEDEMYDLGPPPGFGSQRNPLSFSLGGMSTAETIGVAAAGAVIVGLVGYGNYKLVQGPQAPASYLGPGGSTTPLGPAAGSAARAASYQPPPPGYVQQPGDYPTGDPTSDQQPPFVPGVAPPGAQDA